MTLYPLRFEPIFKSKLWGGRRLPGVPEPPAAARRPDRRGVGAQRRGRQPEPRRRWPARRRHAPRTARRATRRASSAARTAPHGKFPLLLKFIDARQELSVQVHPNDEQAAKLGPGSSARPRRGWFSNAAPRRAASTPGFAEGVTADHFRAALAEKTDAANAAQLHARSRATACSSKPAPFTPSGRTSCSSRCSRRATSPTGSTTGTAWTRRPGKPRQLHVDEGLACADFRRGPCPPVGARVAEAEGVRREGLVDCRYFTLERKTSRVPFRVGAKGECRAVVCIGGSGEIECAGKRYPLATGDTVLLPAEVGESACVPDREIVVLECALPVG